MSFETDHLAIAQQAIDIGSELIRGCGPVQIIAKGDRDFVSDVDVAIERRVRAFLKSRAPDVGFLGEEEGWRTGPTDQIYWALDPIDGTSNFLKQLPLCAISLALVVGDRAILGAIDLPFMNMRYTAVQGQGAYRAGQRLRASQTANLPDAIVAMGDYAVGEHAEDKNRLRLAVTHQLAASAHRVRMFGSAAIDLAWTAEGRIDASIILSNKPWDTAAGVLLAREAGAKVIDLAGADHAIHSGSTIAVAPRLVDSVAGLLGRATSDVPAV